MFWKCMSSVFLFRVFCGWFAHAIWPLSLMVPTLIMWGPCLGDWNPLHYTAKWNEGKMSLLVSLSSLFWFVVWLICVCDHNLIYAYKKSNSKFFSNKMFVVFLESHWAEQGFIDALWELIIHKGLNMSNWWSIFLKCTPQAILSWILCIWFWLYVLRDLLCIVLLSSWFICY